MTTTIIADPETVPLINTIRIGVLVLGAIAALSAASTLALLALIGHRCWRWPTHRRHRNNNIRKNPFVILLANLFLADFVQALAFLFNFHWYSLGSIESYTAPCTVQGFFINLGDVSSAFFVLAIAVQTWAHIKFQQRLRIHAFVTAIVFTWVFALVLTVLGPITTRGYFVDTGAWCWAHPGHNTQRLVYHYLWVFLVEFGTIFVYGFVIWELHRSSRKLRAQSRYTSDQANETYRRIRKSCLIMCCYPILYIALTLPLAVGRMLEISERETSKGYRILCGCFLVSSGWVDSLMYIVTRASFLKLQGQEEDDEEALTSNKPEPSLQQNVAKQVAKQCSNLSCGDDSVPARMTSMSSWNTNWSDTRTLPNVGPEESLSTNDHERHMIAARTLTLEAKTEQAC